jgi:1-aminocyclopropane-1-carboxylate deaminase/D-cysteine desulfhydrase-like pyridoxal-dependent ACC family enzyme
MTPVEKYNNVYYKRDDLFIPFGKDSVNGGKVRQAIHLFDDLHDDIRDNHNGGVVLASSVHSLQSVVVARLAKQHDFNCIVAVGGSKDETLYNHSMMKLVRYYGGEVVNVAGHGMSTVIDARVRDIIIPKTGYKLIKFATNLETNLDAIFEGVIDEVANIPDHLDNLIVPIGSGIQFTGIIKGLQKHNKKVKRIIGISFCDRSSNINKWLDIFKYENFPEEIIEFPEYEIHLTEYPYSKSIWEKVGDFYLDDIYEGKAHRWMRENIDTENKKTLFWIIGRRLTKEEVETKIL